VSNVKSKNDVRLEGGTMLLCEPDSAIPVVDIDIVLRGGSLYDPVGKEGLARIYARLLRRGTGEAAKSGALTSEAFDEAVESLGAALSIDVSTSAVRFHGSVIRRNLEPFFALLASVVQHPALRPRELAHVKREAVAEILSQRDNDRWLAARAFRMALFEGHPYARSALGSSISLKRITIKDVEAFHADRLRASNAVVAFSGDITAADAKALVKRHLALPSGEATKLTLTDKTPTSGLRIVLVDKPDRTQTQIFMGTVGVKLAEPDFYPLAIANTVFGGTFTARLVKEVRSKRGWSYSAQSRLYADQVRDAWSIYTHPSLENAVECVALELRLVRDFVKKGVNAEEVGFAQSFLSKSHAFERDTAAKRLDPRIEAAVFSLPESFHAKYLEHVAKVDAESASRAVQARLAGPGGRGGDLVVAILGPAARLERDLRKLRGVSNITTIPFADLAT
jgi:zinc protease